MLERLYKHHNELIALAVVFSKQDAEDIIQDVYIKVSLYAKEDKLFINDKLNKHYLFIIIRNVYITNYHKKNHTEDITNFEIEYNDFNELEEIDWFNFMTKCKAEVDSWDIYDKKLFSLYRDSGMSMQEISNETKISKTSIFHSLKEHKRKLKDLFQNDYNNLK